MGMGGSQSLRGERATLGKRNERVIHVVHEIQVRAHLAEVRKVFTVDGRAAIAGSYVTEGRITRNAIVRVLRDGREVAKGRMAQLRRFRDDVREVATGYECGITLEDFSEFQEKDILEAYVVEQQNL